MQMNKVETEKERMFAGKPYNAHSDEMVAIRIRTKRILHKLNVTEYYTDKFQDVIRELCPNAAKNFHVEPLSIVTTVTTSMLEIAFSLISELLSSMEPK